MAFGANDLVDPTQPGGGAPAPETAPPAASSSGGFGQGDLVDAVQPGGQPAPAIKGVDRNSKGYAAALAHEQALDQRFNQEPDARTAASHRAAQQSASFNFSDELEGRAAQARAWLEQNLLGYKEPYTPAEAYQARVDETRRQLVEGQKKYPVMSGFGTVAGMVAQAPLLEGGAGAAGNLIRGGRAVEAAAPAARTVGDVVGGLAKHAAVGAGYNVLAGEGARQGDADQRSDLGAVGEDAAAGAAFGGGLSLLGEGLGALGRWRASRRIPVGASSPLPGSEAEAALNAGGWQSGPASPLAARFSDQAARAQAGDRILSAAANPTKFANDLHGPDGQLVPGSSPTTFQQTGDLGVGQLERLDATQNPDDYKLLGQDQNAARMSALRGIEENGDPNALAQTLRAGLAQVDAATDARVKQLQTQAQTQGGALGGQAEPDARGGDIRDAIVQASAEERAKAKSFYDLAYEGNPTGNVTETRDAARQILAQLPENGLGLQPDERTLLEQAANLSPVTPLKELDAIKSGASRVLRQEANSRSPTYMRMAQLRDAIHSNLANSISQRIVEQEAAAARGEIPEEMTLGARMQAAMTGTGGPAEGAAFGGQGLLGQSAAPALGEMDPMALAQVGQAQRDVADWRAGPGPKGGLFGAIIDNGGLRLKDKGVFVQGGPEAAQILDQVRRPGLVTSGGLTPDGMREALQQAGWFQGHPGGGANIQDLLDLMGREARGNTVFHPESDMPAKLARQQALEEEMSRAGVSPKDSRDAAARKLAAYRASQALHAAQGERALTALKMRADSLGVPYRAGVPYHELLGDVLEREAIQSEGLDGPMLDAREHLLQEQLTPDELERHLDYAGGGASPQPEGAGVVPDAAAGGEAPGGQGAAGEPRAGAAGGGADAGAVGPAQAVEQPSITGDQAQALQTGADLWKRYKERFGTGPVAQVLRKEGGTVFARPNGAVGSSFFVKGPTGFDQMNALKGILPEAQFNALMADHAASSLRAAAERPDGTIDPKRFAKWRDDHAQALRALPQDLQQAFSSAADATQAVEEAASSRAERLKAAQEGKLGEIMALHSGEDIRNAVGRVLNAPDAVRQLTILRDAVQHDPDAVQGLRRALVDHILSKVSSTQEAGASGVDALKADAVGRLVRDRADALGVVFSPEEVAGMKAVADDLQRAGRSVQATKLSGSPGTAQDLWAAAKSAAAKHGLGVALSKIPLAGPVVRAGLDALSSRGIARVDQLVHEAMLNPALARELVGAAQARSGAGGPAAKAMAANLARPSALVQALDSRAGSLGGRAAAEARPRR